MTQTGGGIDALAASLVDAAHAAVGRHDAGGVLLDLTSAGDTLVVSCSGIVPDKVIYAMENTSRSMPTAKLFICDSASLWYYAGIPGLTDTFDDTVALVGAIVRRIGPRRVCAIGTSGGGYMALALAARLGFDRVLAFSPQTVIRATWRAAHHDTRWAPRMERIHEIVGPEGPCDIADLLRDARSTEFHVVCPEDHRLDALHAATVADRPNVRLYRIPDAQHNVSAALHKRGMLRPVLDLFIGHEGADLNGAMTRLLRERLSAAHG